MKSLSKQQRADAVQARLRGRSALRGKPSQRRLTRTILLGSVAVALAVYWLADAYGVDGGALLQALWVSIGFVALLAGLAALGGFLLSLVGRRHRGGPARRPPKRGP